MTHWAVIVQNHLANHPPTPVEELAFAQLIGHSSAKNPPNAMICATLLGWLKRDKGIQVKTILVENTANHTFVRLTLPLLCWGLKMQRSWAQTISKSKTASTWFAAENHHSFADGLSLAYATRMVLALLSTQVPMPTDPESVVDHHRLATMWTQATSYNTRPTSALWLLAACPANERHHLYQAWIDLHTMTDVHRGYNADKIFKYGLTQAFEHGSIAHQSAAMEYLLESPLPENVKRDCCTCMHMQAYAEPTTATWLIPALTRLHPSPWERLNMLSWRLSKDANAIASSDVYKSVVEMYCPEYLPLLALNEPRWDDKTSVMGIVSALEPTKQSETFSVENLLDEPAW